MFLSDWCNVKQLLSSYQSSHAADDTDPVSRFSVHGERCARPEVVHSPLSTDDIVSADHLILQNAHKLLHGVAALDK